MSEATNEQPAPLREVGATRELPADTGRQAGLQGVAALLAAAAGNESDGDSKAGDADERRAEKPGERSDQTPGEIDQNFLDNELADKPGGGDTSDQAKAVGSLADLAERAGIKLEDVYKLDIPLQDGRGTMPLGELKDNVTEAARLEQQSDAFDVTRTEFENEMIRARQELNEVLSLLPELPQELIAQAKQKHIAHQDKERQALYDIKPEWTDPATFQRAQDSILEAVAEYGFSRSDLNLVGDHRLTKLLHDFAGLKQRVAKANARLKEVKSEGTKRAGQRKATVKKSESQDRIEQAKKSSDNRSTVRGVAEILKGAQNG